MQNGISDHARILVPLRSLLERSYAKSGKRTKHSIKSIPLQLLGWFEEKYQAFAAIQQILGTQISLVHRNTYLQICVFTDAADLLWEIVDTQHVGSELKKPVLAQRNQPLAFHLGTLSNSEIRWITFRKEGFAFLQTLPFWTLLCEPHIHIFTNHRNHICTFCSTLLNDSLGGDKVMKVQRWAVCLP